MADKQTNLSIVIRTVDKATAGIRAFKERIGKTFDGMKARIGKAFAPVGKALDDVRARMTKAFAPVKMLGRSLRDLGTEVGLGKLFAGFKMLGGWGKAGASKLIAGFKAVGSVVGNVISQIPILGAVVVGTAGAAVAGLMALVNQYDDLGDKAEAMGVGVDFLSQMRYAAEKTGASVEELDAGLAGFSKSLGEARAGTGRMASFLGKVSPALLKQLKAAKSNESAFDLLAGAMAKIEDPAKRAAFAQKTLGSTALSPLLARGTAGIRDLRARYLELAGSQEEAASKSGEVDDAMKDLKASTDGIKAALVTGLAPALKVVVERLREWFANNRGRVAEFAAELGEKLPDAIRAVVNWVERAIGKLGSFFSTLSKIYDKVDKFIHLEERQQANAMRDKRVAFYKKLSKSRGEARTADGFESGAQQAVALEDMLRARIKAQLEGKDWVTDGDAEFGDTSKSKGIYSPADLRALMNTIGPGEASRGAENLVLLQQALTKRQNEFARQRTTADDIASVAREAFEGARPVRSSAPVDGKLTIEIKGAPPGTRTQLAPGSTGDIDLTTGYLLPGVL